MSSSVWISRLFPAVHSEILGVHWCVKWTLEAWKNFPHHWMYVWRAHMKSSMYTQLQDIYQRPGQVSLRPKKGRKRKPYSQIAINFKCCSLLFHDGRSDKKCLFSLVSKVAEAKKLSSLPKHLDRLVCLSMKTLAEMTLPKGLKVCSKSLSVNSCGRW